MTLGAVLTLAYLVGSIPFSFLVARYFGVEDVRSVGSGNVGATNVLRAAGRTAGGIAFLLDALKGVAAVLCTRWLCPGELQEALAAVVAMLGHIFPVWLSFRGGKGVATGAGAFLPLAPVALAAGLAAFAVLVVSTRYVAVASIAGSVTLAATTFVIHASRPVSVAAVCVALLVVWTHRTNLRRLAKGTEAQLGRSEPR